MLIGAGDVVGSGRDRLKRLDIFGCELEDGHGVREVAPARCSDRQPAAGGNTDNHSDNTTLHCVQRA